VLQDRYELIEQIGSGGMATVWRAVDRQLGRTVAVKTLHQNLAEDGAFVERFRREARSAAALAHPNIVTVYDSGDENGAPYIVMELVDGMSLHSVLAASGPLSVAHAARVGAAVLAALDHAHSRGLVHRDVKPGNILVTQDGSVKVADFGIAKGLEEAAGLTQTGTLMGTASYISPEQASGHRATGASDLYALGCVLYECLTGRPPFAGDNPVAVAVQHQRASVPPITSYRADVPAPLQSVVLRALAKSPSERYPSAADMHHALVATGQTTAADLAPTMVMGRTAPATAPIGAPTATQVLPGRRPPRPSRLGRAFGWAAILLMALALVWLVAQLVRVNAPAGATPTPAPTASPAPATKRPTARPTAAPTPSPTPELTEPPTPEIRSPEPVDTPDLSGLRRRRTPTPEPAATP
jgi:serine/threonine-protein kinase